MISQREWAVYNARWIEHEERRGFFSRVLETILWKCFKRNWCPRCQKMTRWSCYRGVGYRKAICSCGFSLVIRGNRIYDIDVRDA